VWSITWHDLLDNPGAEVTLVPPKVRDALRNHILILKAHRITCPSTAGALGNGFSQLLAFLVRPEAAGWMHFAGQMALIPLTILANKHAAGAQASEMLDHYDAWREGKLVANATVAGGSGNWFHATVLEPSGDLLVMGRQEDIVGNARDRVVVRLRLGDSPNERAGTAYLERWRRWLAMGNLFQFCSAFQWFCVSEVIIGTGPDLELGGAETDAVDWSVVLEDILPSLRPLAERLAAAGIAMPEIEVYLESAPDDCFAEMAWPCAHPAVCLLVADQLSFRTAWERAGWGVVTLADIQAHGIEWMKSLLVACKETV
jgi:DEAD/DEAH box helicase domain-containing protein